MSITRWVRAEVYSLSVIAVLVLAGCSGSSQTTPPPTQAQTATLSAQPMSVPEPYTALDRKGAAVSQMPQKTGGYITTSDIAVESTGSGTYRWYVRLSAIARPAADQPLKPQDNVILILRDEADYRVDAAAACGMMSHRVFKRFESDDDPSQWVAVTLLDPSKDTCSGPA